MDSGEHPTGSGLQLLWIAPSVPSPTTGAGTRVFNLIRALAPHNQIDLIAGSTSGEQPPDAVIPLVGMCRTVSVVPPDIATERHKRALQLRSLASPQPMQRRLYYSPAMQQRIDDAVRSTAYDVAILESSFMGYYRLPSGLPVVVDQHNVESEILRRSGRQERSMLRRLYNTVEYWKYRSREVRVCRRADLILATSGRDRESMVQWGDLPPCVVIPNGVDTQYFSPVDETDGEQPPSIVFTGTMSYAPNTEAMLYFAAEIWPLVQDAAPGAALQIVGQRPPPAVVQLGERPGITVTGAVADVRPYIAAAQVVVAPLRIGGGTRLKILEAMAMGRAVVSTSLGCEGLEVRNGRHLMVADEPRAFADRVIELLEDPARRTELGHQARQLVERSYDWDALGRHMQNAVHGIIPTFDTVSPDADFSSRGDDLASA
jgi:sugar transferase (PEP-CTERM/EpsH1 system associated)